MDPARSPSDALTPAVEEKTAQGPLSSPGSFLSSYGVLRGAFLSGADLSGASLHGADLRGADLSSFLKGQFYSPTFLIGADLSDASLLLADLREANLREANLSGADLKEADLRYADLSGATGVTNEQLAQQATTLRGATMPNGQKYEDWLKTKRAAGRMGRTAAPRSGSQNELLRKPIRRSSRSRNYREFGPVLLLLA